MAVGRHPDEPAVGRQRACGDPAEQRLGVGGRHHLLPLRTEQMTAAQRRGLNDAVTRMWSFLAPAYDLPFLQQWVYRPPHDEVIAQLRAHGSRRIADIACGTGILSDRIERELHPDEIYGVDMSDGMLPQAPPRANRLTGLRRPAERLPFEDGALDAVVTPSAFHFFDQPAAL